MDTPAPTQTEADYAMRMRCWELVREFLRDQVDDVNNRVNQHEEQEQ